MGIEETKAWACGMGGCNYGGVHPSYEAAAYCVKNLTCAECVGREWVRSSLCDSCLRKKRDARWAQLSGKVVKVVQYETSGGTFDVLFTDGSHLGWSRSGPMDGHGEYSPTTWLRLAGEK